MSLIASAIKIEPPPIVAPDVSLQAISSSFLDQWTVYNRGAVQKRASFREENSSRWVIQNSIL